MSRPRKTPPPAGSALSLYFDSDELTRRENKVRALWLQAGGSVACPSQAETESLALAISAYASQVADSAKALRDEKAREAMRTLLNWCRFDPDADGLPHISFCDMRLAGLEQAIVRAQPLAEAGPTRAWVNRAWDLWFRVRRIREQRDESVSYSENAHAVVFISLALRWAGHPAATPGAVSMELRRRAEYRDRPM